MGNTTTKMNTTSNYVRQNAESKKAIQDQINKIIRTHRVYDFVFAGVVLLVVGLILFI